MNAPSQIVRSTDDVSIQYDIRGRGTPALVFVHGWCCNRHYWDRQVDYFVPNYTVVCLDLAGHGASGRNRARWTIPAFGQDVAAVVEQLGLEQVVLIGHSMGGAVIVEATRALARIAFAPTSDATLVEDYLKDVATFPPEVAIAFCRKGLKQSRCPRLRSTRRIREQRTRRPLSAVGLKSC